MDDTAQQNRDQGRVLRPLRSMYDARWARAIICSSRFATLILVKNENLVTSRASAALGSLQADQAADVTARLPARSNDVELYKA